MLTLFFQALVIGFAIAAPVGPIGILCINRSVHNGWKLGLATGCGAAIADGTYGAVAGFSLTFISSFLIAHIFWIKLIGGLFLIYLGTKTLLTRPPNQLVIEHPNKNLFLAAFTTFFLTLMNPLSIFAFIAIFAGLGFHLHNNYGQITTLILGIVLGSLLWWILLSCGVAMLFRKHIPREKLYWVNFCSGLMIVIFGVIALISIVNPPTIPHEIPALTLRKY